MAATDTGPNEWRGRVVLQMLVGLVLALAGGTAAAQGAWTVQTVIPNVLTIASAGTTVGFAPGAAVEPAAFQDAPSACGGRLTTLYPPPAFPACYAATVPAHGTLSAQVFANGSGLWSIQLEIPALLDPTSGATIPAERVYFRANGGPWTPGSELGQSILEGSGATDGYLDLAVDFVLLLDGSEHGGSYLANALLTGFTTP